MTTSGSAGDGGAFAERRARFNRWRSGRPFLGGALLILASFVIAWIPINIAPDTILLGKALSPIGLLFAALVFLCGIFALTRPGLADIFGIFGIVFSIFSLYGALGGFGIGLVLGLIGGNLCYAWQAEDEGGSGGSNGDATNDDGFVYEDGTDDSGSGDSDSGGLFGTRSVRKNASSVRSAPSTAMGAGGRTASVTLMVVAIVVLSAFAYPLVAAAAGPFPEQSQIDGTVVVADQFSGQGYNHENVSVDTSNRDSVPAARQTFSSAQIDGMTIYKNFQAGGQAGSIVIKGSSSSAPNGLALTSSEFYASQMSLAGVVPVARNKWSTCPGEDFLLSNGDIGNPPIEAQDVTTNTHQLAANTVTIQDLNLTVQQRAKSTSVTGTPECTTDPVETVLDVFTANALALLAEDGRLNSSAITGSGVSALDAPSEVEQGEPFNVSTTVTNTGYVTDTTTVEYRFADTVVQTKNVTLEPDESATVSFRDTESSNQSGGSYELGVSTENGSATDTITVNEPVEPNETAASNETNASATSANATSTNATGSAENGTTGTNETTSPTATASGSTTTAETTTQSTSEETTTNTTSTASADATSTASESSTTDSETTTVPESSTNAGSSETSESVTSTTTTATDATDTSTQSTSQSSLAGLP